MMHASAAARTTQADARAEPAAAPPQRGSNQPARDRVQHLQRTIGNRAVNALLAKDSTECPTCGERPPQFEISSPGDPLEREADRVAAHVLRSPTPVAITPASPRLSRKCAKCDEEKLHRKADGPSSSSPDAHASVESVTRSPGRPLDHAMRAFFEPRFGHDLGAVRIHDNAAAAASTRAVGALAYTVGNNIAFGSGLYSPGTDVGRQLLAHELVHVVQQRQSGPSHIQLVQRLTHGPSTPTNCHNPSLALPQWLAGIWAHMQLNVFFGVPPMTIPRASKGGGALIGMPTTPLTPPGFADLWRPGSPTIDVAEIKSTSRSAHAAPEAAHYMLRHNEWVSRLIASPTTLDPQDSAYLRIVGGPIPGRLLNLSGRTGSGIAVGPFVADFGKTLWAEADSAGAVCYWCVGPGLPSPAWLLVIQAAIDAMRRRLQELKDRIRRLAQEAEEGLVAFARDLPTYLRWLFIALLIIATIALFVVALLCALGIPVTLGGSSVCTAGAAALGFATVSALLIIVGLSGSGGEDPTTLASLAPRGSESEDDSGYDDFEGPLPSSLPSAMAADPSTRVLAALGPLQGILSNPLTAIQAILDAGPIEPAQHMGTLNQAIAALEQGGDTDTASYLRSIIAGSGLNNVGRA